MEHRLCEFAARPVRPIRHTGQPCPMKLHHCCCSSPPHHAPPVWALKFSSNIPKPTSVLQPHPLPPHAPATLHLSRCWLTSHYQPSTQLTLPHNPAALLLLITTPSPPLGPLRLLLVSDHQQQHTQTPFRPQDPSQSLLLWSRLHPTPPHLWDATRPGSCQASQDHDQVRQHGADNACCACAAHHGHQQDHGGGGVRPLDVAQRDKPTTQEHTATYKKQNTRNTPTNTIRGGK
jgi:hypothetical protein